MVKANKGKLGLMSGAILLLGLTAFLLSLLVPWYGAPIFLACVVLGAVVAVAMRRTRRSMSPPSIVKDGKADGGNTPLEPE